MNQNIKINRQHRTDLVLRNDEYYDLALYNDEVSPAYNFCKVVGFNSETDSYLPLHIKSDWALRKNDGTIQENIGLTGIDNGEITYRKDRIEDSEFYKIIATSKKEFNEGDFNITLSPVSGNTLQYIYPIDISNTGLHCKGGFVQGVFRTPDNKVSLLPGSPDNEWTLSFTLKTNTDYSVLNKTLNEKYPENNGLFFFMGVRAENKFSKIFYNKKEEIKNEAPQDELFDIPGYFTTGSCDTYLERCGCENGNSEVHDCGIDSAMDPGYFADKFDDVDKDKLTTSNGFKLNESGQTEISTENKFLWFDRTPTGYTIHTWDENAEHKIQMTVRPNINLFPWMNHTKTGYTINNISELYKQEVESLNTDAKDIINNAFALKLNNDGSISYRLAVLDCESGTHLGIENETTLTGLFKPDEWFNLKVRIIPTDATHMKLLFYIDGYLKFISKELPKIDFRNLDEINEKQEGVPFNISLGGGTQGLCEMIDLTDYMDTPNEAYFLEKNFAGSLLGDIKDFEFSIC